VGQAENSILPGYVGVETGQAAFGDIFAWFKRLLEWPLAELAADENSGISDELYKKGEDRILFFPTAAYIAAPCAHVWSLSRMCISRPLKSDNICNKIYKPDSEKKDWYKKHYQEYLKLAEAVNKLS